jgi:hypothetical protein
MSNTSRRTKLDLSLEFKETVLSLIKSKLLVSTSDPSINDLPRSMLQSSSPPPCIIRSLTPPVFHRNRSNAPLSKSTNEPKRGHLSFADAMLLVTPTKFLVEDDDMDYMATIDGWGKIICCATVSNTKRRSCNQESLNIPSSPLISPTPSLADGSSDIDELGLVSLPTSPSLSIHKLESAKMGMYIAFEFEAFIYFSA